MYNTFTHTYRLAQSVYATYIRMYTYIHTHRLAQWVSATYIHMYMHTYIQAGTVGLS